MDGIAPPWMNIVMGFDNSLAFEWAITDVLGKGREGGCYHKNGPPR